jgi:hypothetical protein
MKWKEFWRKRSWHNLKYYPGIRLEGRRKTTKTLSQDSWSPGRDLNPGPPEYEAGMLTTRPWRWFLLGSEVRRTLFQNNVKFLRTLYVSFTRCKFHETICQLSLKKKEKWCLWYHHAVCPSAFMSTSVSPTNNFWIKWQIFMKFGTEFMPMKVTSAPYFLFP